jgi:hypothetical protein
VIKAEARNIDLPDTRISDFLQRLSALFSVHDCWWLLSIHPAQNRHSDPSVEADSNLPAGIAEINIHKSGSVCYWFGRASAARCREDEAVGRAVRLR